MVLMALSSQGAGSAGTIHPQRETPRAPHTGDAQPQLLRVLQPHIPTHTLQPCIEKLLDAVSTRAR